MADDCNQAESQPLPSKPVLGLMGAPGSGKSAAAAALAELGCGVIDADKLAQEAIQSDQVKQQLVQWWGPGMLDDGGQVDRSAVGGVVFDQPDELKKLEAVLHPLVHAARHHARRLWDADDEIRAIVEDCPLLLETGLDGQCDVLIMIDAALDIRQQRVRDSRGWDAEELAKRESRQAPLDIKRKAADYVVQNDAGADYLKHQLDSILHRVIQQYHRDVLG